MRLKQKRIYYQESRSIGAMFSDTLRFIRQYFGDLIRTLFFVAGPYVLLLTLFALLYTNEVGEIHLGLKGNERNLDFMMDTIFFMAVLFSFKFLSRSFLSASMAVYMLERESNLYGTIAPSDLSRKLWKKSASVLFTALSVLLILWTIAVIFAVLVYMLYQVSQPLAWLFVVFMCIAVAIFFFPLSYTNASLYLIIFKENISGFKAIKKAFKTMKGNFWQGWVVFLLATVVIFGSWWLISQPVVIYDMIQNEFSDQAMFEFERFGLGMVLLTLIGDFLSTLIYGFYYTLCHFQYYSNEEKQNGTGLKKRILEIGNKKTFKEFEPSY